MKISRSKYGARKVVIDGEVFDSKKEYRRFCELALLEKAGQIAELKRQQRFTLIPTQRNANGKCVERPVTYIADFVYQENGETVVEDTKGFRTKDYIIKRKLMLWVHGIQIREI